MIAWGRGHYVDYPWRATDSRWLGLSAEVLLQRTRAEQVLPVYADFAERYPTPDHVVREKPAAFARVVRPLGLHWRAPLLKSLARTISDLGAPPDSSDELTRLPGVGPYAAAAYLSFHRGVRAVIVDSNIVRLLGRVFGFETGEETRRKRWLIELADWLTPKRAFRQYNYAVLDLAMTLCRPRPGCSECPLAKSACTYARLHTRVQS